MFRLFNSKLRITGNVCQYSTQKTSKKPALLALPYASRKNVPQSPMKMGFLAELIRNKWVPDAFAQLKFTPKKHADVLARIVNRACMEAKRILEKTPEELYVKEVIVTKGQTWKRLVVMSRGRTGLGMSRDSHVTVKVAAIDFDKNITEAKTSDEKTMWVKRKNIAETMKTNPPTFDVQATQFYKKRVRARGHSEEEGETDKASS